MSKFPQTQPNDPVFPLPETPDYLANGLTVREEFAKAAMQGVLAAYAGREALPLAASTIANVAVQYADALIDALNKGNKT